MSNIIKAASMAAVTISAAGTLWMTDPSFANTNGMQIAPALQVIQPEKTTSTQSTPQADQDNTGQLDTAAVQVVKPVAEQVPVKKSADLSAVQKKAEKILEDIDRSKTASSLAALVKSMPTDTNLSAEEHCLAGAVYFESKSESLAGQLAVARVVINRAKSGRFPSSFCGVVYQPSQFSFVRGRSMPYINKAGQQWKNAVAIAQIAMDNSWKSDVEGALFFHATYVSPGWKLRRVAQIDNHIFYR